MNGCIYVILHSFLSDMTRKLIHPMITIENAAKEKQFSIMTKIALSPVVLVAGGAGFIGSHLCDCLIDDGYKVICIDNLYTGSLHNIEHLMQHPRFTFVNHDVTTPYTITELSLVSILHVRHLLCTIRKMLFTLRKLHFRYTEHVGISSQE